MKEIITDRIERLLSKEYYCSPQELNGKDTVYSVNTEAKQPYIKILAYRNCVTVCTSKDLSAKIQELLRGKSRDEMFEIPFVYGQTIHYVPDPDCLERVLAVSGDQCEFLFEKEVWELSGLTGFENSVSFDDDGMTPAKAVYIARDGGAVVGAAGAAVTSVDGVWEVGVDVMAEYRNAGLGSRLVSGLTKELLTRNIVPFYSASVTNIGSQMVACRCGYIPSWVDTFGTTLDGSSVYRGVDSVMSSNSILADQIKKNICIA